MRWLCHFLGQSLHRALHQLFSWHFVKEAMTYLIEHPFDPYFVPEISAGRQNSTSDLNWLLPQA